MNSYSNCHCFIEITSKVFNYEGIDAESHNFELLLYFIQNLISLLVVLITTIYIIYCVKKKKILYFFETSIFHYLDFVIPELLQHAKSFDFPMRVKKSHATKSISLLIRNNSDKNSSFLQQTTLSNPQNISRDPFSVEDLSRLKGEIHEKNKENEDFHVEITPRSSPLLLKSSENEGNSMKTPEIGVFLEKTSLLNKKIKKNTRKIVTKKTKNDSRADNYFVNFEINTNENNKKLNNKSNSKVVYICDCNDCCFECCPDIFQIKLIKPITHFIESQNNRLRRHLLENCKIICYFLIYMSPFLDKSLSNVLSVMISACLKEKIGAYFQIFYIFYSIIYVTLQSLFFFACIFISSFISTKRELMEIDCNDKTSRGYLVYYHVKKAFVFSCFHFFLQMILQAIFLLTDSFFSSTMGNDSLLFCLLKNMLYFCFIVSKYPNFRNINQIQHDDNVLKSQFKYFNIQNFLIKYLPKENSVYEAIKEKNVLNHEFIDLNAILEKKLRQAKKNLKEELKIIEKQKFQVILRNRGVSPLIPIALMWYIIIDSFLSIIIAIVFLMKLNYSEIIPFSVFTICNVLNIILTILEFAFLPWLIRIALHSKTFFENEEN